MTTRQIVIGDLHGCVDEFRELVELLGYSQGSDQLVLVGDLMDRGPDPVGCIRYAQEMKATVTKGNHEEKHHRYWRHEQRVRRELAAGVVRPKKNPMTPLTGPRGEVNASLTEADVEWLEKLPLMVKLSETFVVVHAGLEPAYRVPAQSNSVLRVRYVGADGRMRDLDHLENTTYWSETWRGPESVAYGHAVHSFTEPRIDRFPGGACYGIDLGCVYGGSLCALVLNDGSTEPEFVTVRARREYHPIGAPRE